MPSGFLRSVLPVRIRAQGEHKRQRFFAGEKIRLLGGGAQQIQRDHRAGIHQSDQQTLRGGECFCTGGRLTCAHAGFDKRRRGRGQLRVPRQVQTKRMLLKPALRIVKRQQRVLLLPPMGGAGYLELFGYQEKIPSSRGRDPPRSMRREFRCRSLETLDQIR